MQRGGSIELHFEGFTMQKWNITTDRAQKADEKNGFIYQVTMFNLGVI